MNNILIPTLEKKYFFLITSANRTIIGNKKMEFIQEKGVEFCLTEKSQSQFIFRYKLHNHQMKGSSLIHYWTDDMEELQSELILVIDENGILVDIDNFDQLNSKWAKMGGEMRSKYKDETVDAIVSETTKLLKNKQRLLETFTGYSSWRFFLQNWYNRKFGEEEQSKLLLKGYFGAVDLPLIISSKAKNYTNKEILHTIENTAVLDKKNFQRKDFARMLKTLTNMYNIDANLSVDMEEKYEFQEDGWIDKAEMFLETSVTNWYSVTNAHQLNRLNQDEFDAYHQKLQEEKAAFKNRHNLILD
jgi:hypothetical protein